MSYDLSILKEGIREYGVTLTDRQEEQFMRYYQLLVQWNEVMNLTAITEFDQVLLKHFADSLSIAGTLDMEKIHSCIDVGTGAGFPGIPLKIAFPHLKVTLLDSLNKRLNFLDEVIGELGLEKISTVHLRAEEGGKKPEYREKYDLAVSRAVSRLSVLCEYCMPYVRKGGYFVSYKAGQAEEEIKEGKKAIAVLGGKLTKTESFHLCNTDMERILVVIKKVKDTPKKYPRKPGTPAKEPLGSEK